MSVTLEALKVAVFFSLGSTEKTTLDRLFGLVSGTLKTSKENKSHVFRVRLRRR